MRNYCRDYFPSVCVDVSKAGFHRFSSGKKRKGIKRKMTDRHDKYFTFQAFLNFLFLIAMFPLFRIEISFFHRTQISFDNLSLFPPAIRINCRKNTHTIIIRKYTSANIQLNHYFFLCYNINIIIHC